MKGGEEHKSRGIAGKIADMYLTGFRNMRTGRKLWALIIIKLILIFGVLKLFFFPDVLRSGYATDSERAEAVREQLTTSRP